MSEDDTTALDSIVDRTKRAVSTGLKAGLVVAWVALFGHITRLNWQLGQEVGAAVTFAFLAVPLAAIAVYWSDAVTPLATPGSQTEA